MGLKENSSQTNIYTGLSTRVQLLNTKDLHLFETTYIRVVVYVDMFEHRKGCMDEKTFYKHFKKLGAKE